MDRNVLISTIKSISEILKMDDLSTSLNKPNWDGVSLLNLLVESKSGYDKCLINAEKNALLREFGADHVYTTENFTVILSIVSKITPSNNSRSTYLPTNSFMNSLHDFLKTYASTQKVLNSLLS